VGYYCSSAFALVAVDDELVEVVVEKGAFADIDYAAFVACSNADSLAANRSMVY